MSTVLNPVHPQIQEWLRLKGVSINGLASSVDQNCMQVYRVLKGQTKHKPVITLLKLCRVFRLVDDSGSPDLDEFAHHTLDYSAAYFQQWLKLQMIKNSVPSARQLAIRSGLGLHQIQDILNGEYQYIQLHIYRNIAVGLGVSLSQLLGVLFEGYPEQELLKPLRSTVKVSKVNKSELGNVSVPETILNPDRSSNTNYRLQPKFLSWAA